MRFRLRLANGHVIGMGPFILGQRIVTINVDTMDRYVRTLGKVILPDVNSMNRELVRAGYACWHRKYSSDKRWDVGVRGTCRSVWSLGQR
jgi:hypothetical protein